MTLEWPEIDSKKAERAKGVKLVSTDKEKCIAECIGSSGEIYRVSLSSCTCGDFIRHHSACKHMIRLAMELGFLNEFGRTAEQQRESEFTDAKNKLAYWYGCYYLFGSHVVSDEEYDALKNRLINDFGLSFQEHSIHCSIPSDPLSSVRIFLESQNYEYVDKTAQGGCLYIFDEKAVNVIRAMGLSVCFAAEGTRATKHRPAWYIKPNK